MGWLSFLGVKEVHPADPPFPSPLEESPNYNEQPCVRFFRWAHYATVASTLVLVIFVALLTAYFLLIRTLNPDTQLAQPKWLEKFYNDLKLQDHEPHRSNPNLDRDNNFITANNERGSSSYDDNHAKQEEPQTQFEKPPVPVPLTTESSRMNDNIPSSNSLTQTTTTSPQRLWAVSSYDSLESLLNNSECRILNIYDAIQKEAFVNFKGPPSVSKCIWEGYLSSVLDKKILHVIPQSKNLQCCIKARQSTAKQFGSPQSCAPLVMKSNGSFEMDLNSTNISLFFQCNETNPSSTEVIANFTQIVINAVKEEVVHEKVDHWKEIGVKNIDSYSVLIIGIDGLSRYRARRELSSSLGFLNANKFSEMKGYHMIGPKSMGSFLPLVTGWTYQDVLFRCKQLWDTNVDTCPFVWRQFYKSEYITTLAGDIPEIISPLKTKESQYFDYVIDNEVVHFMKESLSEEECKDTSTVEGLLNIVHKIVTSHESVPKFTLLWLNETSFNNHEENSNTKSFDKTLRNFLLQLMESETILDNSLIFFATHTAYSDPILETDVTEHRLPSLFIRLPNTLVEQDEVIKTTIIQNMDRLTTPFTLHESLKRIWYHHRGHSPFDEKTPSIFDSIPETDSCEAAGIPKQNCACNPHAPMPILQKDEALGLRMSKKSVKHLNENIHRSFTKADNCSKLAFNGIKNLRKYLVDDDGAAKFLQFHYILHFKVLPSGKLFQAKFTHFPKGDRLILNPPVEVLNIKRESRFEGYCYNDNQT